MEQQQQQQKDHQRKFKGSSQTIAHTRTKKCNKHQNSQCVRVYKHISTGERIERKLISFSIFFLLSLQQESGDKPKQKRRKKTTENKNASLKT